MVAMKRGHGLRPLRIERTVSPITPALSTLREEGEERVLVVRMSRNFCADIQEWDCSFSDGRPLGEPGHIAVGGGGEHRRAGNGSGVGWARRWFEPEMGLNVGIGERK